MKSMIQISSQFWKQFWEVLHWSQACFWDIQGSQLFYLVLIVKHVSSLLWTLQLWSFTGTHSSYEGQWVWGSTRIPKSCWHAGFSMPKFLSWTLKALIMRLLGSQGASQRGGWQRTPTTSVSFQGQTASWKQLAVSGSVKERDTMA